MDVPDMPNGTTAYIASGKGLDVGGVFVMGVPVNVDMLNAHGSAQGYDFYRGFYWSSSAGRWYQGNRGAQVVVAR